jgi:mono/diheme cytochrome c family protein
VFRTIVKWALATLAVLVVAIQVVPYGRDHANPPVTKEPAWDAPRTRELAVRACFDCHSNETAWPWYASVAPFSWLVQSDVDEGRRKLNFSEWDRPRRESRDSVKTVRRGRMPPWYYPWAGLSPSERDALVRGLEATLSLSAKKTDD